jgi:hypothetical protein
LNPQKLHASVDRERSRRKRKKLKDQKKLLDNKFEDSKKKDEPHRWKTI